MPGERPGPSGRPAAGEAQVDAHLPSIDPLLKTRAALGAGAGDRRVGSAHRLTEGDGGLLYTDGVTEARTGMESCVWLVDAETSAFALRRGPPTTERATRIAWRIGGARLACVID